MRGYTFILTVEEEDNGGEYTSNEFADYCKLEGITRHFTIPGTPQQNGVAERLNRTILERARSMLITAGLDRKFWAEAVNTSVYLINRSPATDLHTPEEMWSGKEVYYSHLKVFGCKAYFKVQTKTKFDLKARRGVLLDYGDGVKGYRIFDHLSGRVVTSRDVTFHEEFTVL